MTNMTTTRRVLVTVVISTALSFPTPRWAATAELPWDCTLIGLQDMLITYLAPAAIGLALSGAIARALGGRDEQAGRLFGSALGGCIALAVVYLMNFTLP